MLAFSPHCAAATPAGLPLPKLSGFFDARFVLGTAYFRSNRATESLAGFLSVLSRNPDDVEALAGAAAAYL